MFHFLVVSYFKPYENGTPSVLYKIKKKTRIERSEIRGYLT